MDIHQIRCFQRVAEQRSFTAAAKQLNITQPALSRQVQSLEDELGTMLLLRSTRGVQPTDAGRVMMEMGGKLLDYVEGIRRAVTHAAREPVGEVVVGLPPSLSGCMVPAIIDECRAALPQVRLRIIEGLSIFIEEWLAAGRIDLAILTHRPGMKFSQTPLCEEDFVLVRRFRDADGGEEDISFETLTNETLVLTRGFKDVINRHMPEGRTLHCDLEMDSIAGICNVLSNTDLCTVLPSGVVQHERFGERFKVLRIHDPNPTRALVIGRDASRPMSAATRAVQRAIQTSMQRMPVMTAALH